MTSDSDTAAHWETVYATKPTDQVSWHQPEAAMSLRLITAASSASASVVDVGAGASPLADGLLDAGYGDVTVLDVSAHALAAVQARLAHRTGVSYVTTDLLNWQPDRTFDVLHDRAVFHFLIDLADRQQYVATVASVVTPGGVLVLGTFAADGPTSCSGLPTARYSPDDLAAQFKGTFTVEHAEREEHHTPAATVQPFTWLVLRRSQHDSAGTLTP